MADGKSSFVLYCDQKTTWDKLDDAQAGKLIKHIFAYVNDENPSPPDFVTELAFEPIKQQLKRDLKKWEKTTIKRSLAGKAGADARWQTMANDAIAINDIANDGNGCDPMAKMADNVNVNVNDSVSDNVNDKYSNEWTVFWDTYAKKVDLKKCKEKFKKLKPEEVSAILAHIPKYVNSTPDVKYRKNPLTYLNGRGWEDEILQAKPVNDWKPFERHPFSW
jgi:hypothetical protein